MLEAGKKVSERVNKIKEDLQGLDLCDPDALIRIGASLEEALQEVPPEMSGLAGLLERSLEGLQSVYQNAAPDPHLLVGAVASALDAAARYLLLQDGPDGETLIAHAAHSICQALGLETGESPGGSDCGPHLLEGVAECSLDDVAALLVQTEVTDNDGLASIREAVDSIATKGSTPPSVRELLAEASRRVGQIIEGSIPRADSALAEVGKFLEEAAYAVAALERGDLPSPPAASTQEESEAGLLPADADPALLAEFLAECRDYIQAAEAALLSLETDPQDMEAVNTVFRAFHTVKGTSAFLGLSDISGLAHRAESLLSRIRDGEIRCTGGYADLALRSVDMLKELMQAVEDAMGGEKVMPPGGLKDLMRLLDAPDSAGITDESDLIAEEAPRLGDILVAEGIARREDVEAAEEDKGNQPIGVALLRSGSASLSDVAKALRKQQRMKGAESAADSSVRVHIDRLDKLIEMVGELVIAHAMISQDKTVVSHGRHQLVKKVTHAGKIVRELQDLTMSMRMVPLKGVFQKIARLSRDLSRKGGKIVNYHSEGEDTEIDRNMVDVLSDPLVHMVRNAVDHGIEPPEVREKSSKPRAGNLSLSAYHSEGSVVVEIRDDGRGLDREKIVKKALSRGMIEPGASIADGELFNLIFEPGFSTVEEVTDVSGRGVGMDVVRRGIQALRGRIEISSRAGEGSTFLVRLPLTLAVIDGMLLEIGARRYIIPISSIYMMFRPDKNAIHTVGGRGEMVMFRGDLLPMFRLHRLLGIPDATEDPCDGLLLIVEDGDRRCALLVDEVLGQQQVVAKSLDNGIGKIGGVSAAAILGDGRVGLILDLPGIVALARQAPRADHECPAIGGVRVRGGRG